MSDFIRRMDTNGNGMLDPSEREGRMGDFINRVAESSRGIDPNRPIPLDRLSQAMDRYREERMRGDSGGNDNDRDSNNRDNNSRGRSSRSDEPEPLVPGFETLEDPLPVAGFGTAGDLVVVQVTDADRREAEDRLRRYDRNNDGRLSREELGEGRWSDDPFQFDTNRDGSLTANELAVRYARRRVDRTNEQALRESNSSSNSSSGSSSGFRFSFNRSRDENGDERRSGERGFGERGFGERGFGDGEGEEGSRYGFRDKAPPAPKSYRLSTPAERLPKGLPEWFARSDVDGDGQVMMAEFAQDWTDAAAAQFDSYDRNGDGVITPSECLETGDKGSPSASLASRSRFSPSTPRRDDTPSATQTASTESESSAASEASESSEPAGTAPAAPSSTAEGPSTADIDPKVMRYAASLFAKYDMNGDGVLSAEEYSDIRGVDASADTNGDGALTKDEIALKLSGK